jgi:hypothetical protein
MIEYWKYYEGYKFYTDDKEVQKIIMGVTGSKIHSTYFDSKGKKVGVDIIIRGDRLKMLLQTLLKNKQKIKSL